MCYYDAISDIHGYADCFQAALAKVSLEPNTDHHLILLGDYLDKGPQSYTVLQQIMQLETEYPQQVVTLFGNHDEAFYHWLTATQPQQPAAPETLKSFFSETEYMALVANYPDRLSAVLHHILRTETRFDPIRQWLTQHYHAPRTFETEQQIYVHAGIDERFGQHWKWLTEDIMFTNKYPVSTGSFYKDIIAGHISTYRITRQRAYLGRIYHDGDNHYYIDGDVHKSHRLPVLRYHTKTRHYSELS